MPRILLVEDDENLRDMVQEWLIFEKYTVACCGSGLEAIEQLSVLSFDIILLDWHLNDVDGIDVLKKYRAAGGAAPVLMLTGSTTLAQREEALVAGANSYLSKPFKLRDLSANLTQLLAGSDSPR